MANVAIIKASEIIVSEISIWEKSTAFNLSFPSINGRTNKFSKGGKAATAV